MRIIEEMISGKMFSSAIFSQYFSGMRLVTADIETTGLSPRTCSVILGGAVSDYGDGRRVVQFFGDTPEDEKELLKRYAEYLSQFDAVVTYNGRQFDLPFIIKRMKKHGLDTSGIERLYSLDMYRVVKYHSHLPEILPDLRQKTVEVFMGDSEARTDEISGADSVKLYYEYVQSSGKRRAELLDYILLHNRDDVVRLSDMMRILKTLDMHEIMHKEGFRLSIGDMSISIAEIKISRGKIKAKGTVNGDTCGFNGFNEASIMKVDERNRKLELEISCEDVNGYIVADLKILGIDSPELEKLGGYESGYLIVKNGEKIYHNELNQLVRAVIYSYAV